MQRFSRRDSRMRSLVISGTSSARRTRHQEVQRLSLSQSLLLKSLKAMRAILILNHTTSSQAMKKSNRT